MQEEGELTYYLSYAFLALGLRLCKLMKTGASMAAAPMGWPACVVQLPAPVPGASGTEVAMASLYCYSLGFSPFIVVSLSLPTHLRLCYSLCIKKKINGG